MGDEQKRLSGALEFGQGFEAFGLKSDVAARQHFVHEQDVGIGVNRVCKCEPHHHAGGVSAQRIVDELPDTGVLDDLIDQLHRAFAATAQQCGVKYQILRTREVRMEARSQLEQRGHASINRDAALVGRAQSRSQAQERALTGAVAPDNAEALAGFELKRDVLEGNEVLHVAAAKPARDVRAQQLLAGNMQEPFRNIVEFDYCHGLLKILVKPFLEFVKHIQANPESKERNEDEVAKRGHERRLSLQQNGPHHQHQSRHRIEFVHRPILLRNHCERIEDRHQPKQDRVGGFYYVTRVSHINVERREHECQAQNEQDFQSPDDGQPKPIDIQAAAEYENGREEQSNLDQEVQAVR